MALRSDARQGQCAPSQPVKGRPPGWNERSTKVGELLHEAAETRHQVFRISDGADDDWASWSVEWLVTLSELRELLGTKVVRSELTYMLVRLPAPVSSEMRHFPTHMPR
jgi:hypothetical protein